MAELAALFGWCLLATVGFLSIVFIVATRLGRYDLIDVAWGPAFIVVAAISLLMTEAKNSAGFLVFGLVTIWGLRLGWHILRRFLGSSHEDPRYTELRQRWPLRYRKLQVFVRIYMVQAFLACVVSLPVIIFIWSSSVQSGFVAVGAAIWTIGFVCEAVADRQLRQFLAKPKNRGALMKNGLWRYSRHPNYFGEITQWWGIGVMALGVYFGVIGLVGPLVITLLIIFVTGVPPAEKRAAKKPGWKAYKHASRLLVPLPK